MKKSVIKVLAIQIFLILILSLNNFLFDLFKVREYFYAIVMVFGIAWSILLVGYAKDKHVDTKNVNIAVTTFTVLYQVIVFVLFGIIFGFSRIGYVYGFEWFSKVILPLLMMIVASEILRHQFLIKSNNHILVFITTIVLFALIDIFGEITTDNISTFKGIFEIVTVIIFPAIMKNSLLNFLSFNYGYKTTIIYRLVVELPILFLPIYPTIESFFEIILGVLFPFLLLMFFIRYRSTKQQKEQKVVKKPKKKKVVKIIINVVFYSFVIVFVMLISGVFKYFFLAVGSGSMIPTFDVGDMPIVKKVTKQNTLKEGDVLVFRKENKVVMHRIIEMTYNNGTYKYRTKGDNNKDPDNWVVDSKEVIGKIIFNVKYIGYPTVVINNLLNR